MIPQQLVSYYQMPCEVCRIATLFDFNVSYQSSDLKELWDKVNYRIISVAKVRFSNLSLNFTLCAGMNEAREMKGVDLPTVVILKGKRLILVRWK